MIGQSTMCKYWQLMLINYGVPTYASWIISNQGGLISRDLLKKVYIDRHSASFLRSVLQQLLLGFWVIVGTSASHKPKWIWNQLLGSCCAFPICIWHKDTELIGCLRHRYCAVRWQRTPWIIYTSKSMQISTSRCLWINIFLSRELPLTRKVIVTRLSVNSYMILDRLMRWLWTVPRSKLVGTESFRNY